MSMTLKGAVKQRRDQKVENKVLLHFVMPRIVDKLEVGFESRLWLYVSHFGFVAAITEERCLFAQCNQRCIGDSSDCLPDCQKSSDIPPVQQF